MLMLTVNPLPSPPPAYRGREKKGDADHIIHLSSLPLGVYLRLSAVKMSD
jgi:hypothetical protein